MMMKLTLMMGYFSILVLGLFWMGFHDAIREGDGERVMMYWKFLLPIFKTLGRKNYIVECVKLQLQRDLTISLQDSLHS